MMKNYLMSVMMMLSLSTLCWAEPERATFGVVGGELSPALRVYTGVEQGVPVRAVWPGSPAELAGVKSGDVILKLDGVTIKDKAAMAAFLLQRKVGDEVRATLSFGGQIREVVVKLLPRPTQLPNVHHSAEAAVGGDRMHRPMAVSEEIRRQFRERRRNICRHFATLPESFDAPGVTEELQAIRDLARDANPGGSGWMVGRAGVSAVQFRDAEGILLLRGAHNLLTLEVYSSEGKLLLRCGLNNPDEWKSLPAEVLNRLQKL